MSQQRANLEEVVELASKLSPKDRVRLIALLVPFIERDLPDLHDGPKKSLLGLCANLGQAPSAEDIDDVRRQEWAVLPIKGK